MPLISRRGFLHSVAATAVAPAILRARQRPPQFPISFSTLGCPKWPWARILEQASSLGYAAIELRGIEGEMDLTKRPEFIGTQVGQSLKDLAALNLKISDLGASSRMHEADPKVRTAQLDEGRRFIDLANRLGVPYVRVFGDKVPAGETRASAIARVIDGLRTLGEHAKGSGVSVVIESHGDFTDSPSLLEILKGAAMPTVALLWDAHHTCVASKEDPAATFKAPRVLRSTHASEGLARRKARASDTSSRAAEPCPSGRRSRCWPRAATAATTASNGRRRGIRRSRSPRWRSRTTPSSCGGR